MKNEKLRKLFEELKEAKKKLADAEEEIITIFLNFLEKNENPILEEELLNSILALVSEKSILYSERIEEILKKIKEH